MSHVRPAVFLSNDAFLRGLVARKRLPEQKYSKCTKSLRTGLRTGLRIGLRTGLRTYILAAVFGFRPTLPPSGVTTCLSTYDK